MGLAINASAQSNTPFFESPWRGFDTGTFATNYDPGGFGPNSVASGDLDGDGDSDVVVGNGYYARAGLSVLKNAGDGTYSWPAFYTLPYNKSVGDIVLSDVDGDGDLDALATVPDIYGLSNILALWRNNGDGTFAEHVEFTTGPGPVGLVVADFNGDGFADVAMANYGYISGQNNSVSVLRHNGQTGAAAGYLAPVDFAVTGIHTLRVATADLNNDRRPDLVVSGNDTTSPDTSRFGVLVNDGAGGFSLAATYESTPGSRLFTGAVALSDLDNDGDADLIGGGLIPDGSSDNGAISIRRNNGNGTFGPAELYLSQNFEERPQSFALGDLNRDGFTDIVACTPTGRTTDGWVTLLSNGTGGFLPPVRYEASQQTLEATLTDADRDGDLDVVTVAQSSAAITVHRNPGNGVFTVPARNLIGLSSQSLVGNFTQAVEAGDVDNDGDVDIVTNDEKAYILKNNGNGTFAAAAAYTPPMNFGEVKLRDLNGDGRLDLLFGPDPNIIPYHFGSALNNGDGTFAPGTITHVNACAAGSIDAFDLDNDGDLDVVLTEEGSCRGGEGNRIFIARNDGRASFTLLPPIIPDCIPFGIGGADLNGDGRIDLVTSGCTGTGVLLGNGDLTFQPMKSSSTAPFKFRLADMNFDGKIDVAMIVPQGSFGTLTIGTALGNGDGTFAPVKTQSGSSVLENLRIANDLDVADANGDGHPDVVVTNYVSNDISLLLNDGTGGLVAHQRYGVGNAPSFSAFADFTGDRAPDIASAIGLPRAGLKSAVVVLRNIGYDPIVGTPVVTVTSPTSGATYDAPATIHVAADVQPIPGRPISKVEFYLGDGKGTNPKLVYTDTTAPYGGFDLTNQPAGTYSIYAFAYDTEDVGISGGVLYTVKATATPPAPAGGDTVWVEDKVPAGGVEHGSESWNWVGNEPAPFSGSSAHQSGLAAGVHHHYFDSATATLKIDTGDKLFAYVYLDPGNVPDEVMLQWHDGTGWHNAYWGKDSITSVARQYAGPLPAAGQWARLEVSASVLGLEGKTLSGMSFVLNNGRATWDHAGKTASTGTTIPSTEQAWVEDSIPAGGIGKGTEPWAWIDAGPSPYSGSKAHQSNVAAGLHHHYFYSATDTLSVNAGDRLFTYVYLDPANVPEELMLQWSDGSNWYNAYWGADKITSVARQFIGPLPTAGQWVRLEVPASRLGLEGKTLSGMAFVTWGGRSTWDRAGKVPTIDTVWVEDGAPAGAITQGTEPWTWANANPAPFSGASAHQSSLATGLHHHYFHSATATLAVNVGDKLFAYVYVDPGAPPSELMLQWYDGAAWHNAYWGADNITSVRRQYVGPMPAAGQWVRLEVSASQLGLEGKTLSGMSFVLYNGRATWDRAGK